MNIHRRSRTVPSGAQASARVALLAVIAFTTLAVSAPAAVTAPGSTQWQSPIGPPHGATLRAFDAPLRQWSPGHRGVDLAAPPGTPVRAAADGTVTFAGVIAGRGVMVVQHEAVRSTYEPVDPEVAEGTVVAVGQTIGTLARAGSHCAPATCLHWGVREGERYLDPQALLVATVEITAHVRLLPLGNRALTGDAPSRPDDMSRSGERPTAGGPLTWPVTDRFVTSPYGMRTHPVTGEHKLHDGTDFRAPCGTPVRASSGGVVTRAGWNGPYGLQVAIDHGGDSSALSTSYSHLSRVAVTPGQQVRAGHVIGWSGTTGRSTGCHLHFMVHIDGAVTDPMHHLPH